MSDHVDTRAPRVARARCPFCHDDVRPDDPAKVGCSACMAWHHEPCWSEGGGCSACGHQAPPRARLVAFDKGAPDDDVPVLPDLRARRRPWLLPLIVGLGVVAGAGLVTGVVLLGRAGGGAAGASGAAWRAQLERASTEEERTAAARLGAEAGDPGAMNMLGFRLLTGTGCRRDPAEALTWGERAGEAGHAEAMFGVGTLYETGEAGVRDEALAASWYRRAMAAGDTMAGARLDALLRRRPDLR